MTEASTIGTDLAPARTSTWNSILALFSSTFARQVGSKRTLVLVVLYALPILLAVMIRESGAGWKGPTAGYEPEFAEFVLVFNLIPQVLVPLTALIFASGMIQDEVEDQTITYLLIRPLPRWSIFAAKFLATLLATVLLISAFTSLTFLAIGWGQAGYWGAGGGLVRMLKTMVLFALSLAAYNSLFGLLSLLMRRSVLLGIVYIVVLEGFVANIDFVIRKGTVMYHYRVLCERWIGLGQADKANIDLVTAPELWESATSVLVASAVGVLLACLLMGSREFRVKTPEGS